MEILHELLAAQKTITGRVDWIGISPVSRGIIQPQTEVQIVTGGIDGDHHCRPNVPRNAR
ncbi:MAG UNVERIFIED_CONTAM: hypothetical protein LVR18_32580 [Planctomycetaceae bacterium]|jgi:hypothetical protein